MKLVTTSLLLLFLSPFVMCKPVDDIEALDNYVDAMATENVANNGFDKREVSSNKSLLQTCYKEGHFSETVKALGVLNIDGVSLVKVSGALYQSLLGNKTVVVPPTAQTTTHKSPTNSTVKRDEDMASLEDEGQRVGERDHPESDAGSEHFLCKEQDYVTYELAHASEQLAYAVRTVRCHGNECVSQTFKSLLSISIGRCMLHEHKMVIYIINSDGQFIPKTIKIGVACKCKAFLP